MSIVVPGGATPRSFASGLFVLSTLQSGPRYQLTIAPTLDLSNAAYSGDHALLACNNDAGLYLRNRQVSLFNTTGGAVGTPLVQSAVLTAGPGQAITIQVNLAVGTNASSLVVNGVSTPFTAAGTFFDTTTLGVGQWTNSGTFVFNGTVSAVEDGVSEATGASDVGGKVSTLSLIHISEPTRPY